jgi:hypothetical protein
MTHLVLLRVKGGLDPIVLISILVLIKAGDGTKRIIYMKNDFFITSGSIGPQKPGDFLSNA